MPNPNPRFTAQKGIFTQALKGIDIWEYVEILSNKRPNEEIIVKFRILTKDREKCLYDLHLMKIDHVSLLLDFHDIAFRCNQKFSANKE